MDLIKCDKCGEMYSPSYRRCPFCEEDEHPRRAKPRTSRGTSTKKHAQSARGGLIVALSIVLLILSWYFFGDKLIERIRPEQPSVEPDPTEEVTAPERDPSDPFFDPNAEPGTEPGDEVPTPDPDVDVSNAKLNRTDFTLSGKGATFQMEVSGTEATPVWSIENENVATVSDTGLITTVANGDTTVFAQVGARKLECIVRVRNAGTAAEANPNSGTSSVSGAYLSSKDFTAKPGEKVQLRVRGTDASVSWSVGNSSVATVSADGLVTGVARGTTTVYAKVGDRTLECIVRIK